jgi:hypothetical protein
MAMTQFLHKGETWTRHSVTPARTFIMGLDIGQSQDSTAMSVMEWNHVGTASRRLRLGDRHYRRRRRCWRLV